MAVAATPFFLVSHTTTYTVDASVAKRESELQRRLRVTLSAERASTKQVALGGKLPIDQHILISLIGAS
jgi:hypothetical protein